jgi:Holliday junction resolvase RusA-like endonuclease
VRGIVLPGRRPGSGPSQVELYDVLEGLQGRVEAEERLDGLPSRGLGEGVSDAVDPAHDFMANGLPHRTAGDVILEEQRSAATHRGALSVADGTRGKSIAFFVPGMPAPGGSKRAFRTPGGRILVTEDCRRSRPWRAVVQVAAHAAHAAPPLEGPLRLTVTFTMPRPRGHYGRRGLRPSAPPYPTTRPDCTKLLRALEDSCTGLLWRDDATIVEQHVAKVYGTVPGAAVRVEVLSR